MELALLPASSTASTTRSPSIARPPSQLSSEQSTLRASLTSHRSEQSPIVPSPQWFEIDLQETPQLHTLPQLAQEPSLALQTLSLRRASFTEYLGMQGVRHLVSVGAVATLSQGLATYYMGKLFENNKDAALALQVGLTLVSIAHQIACSIHTESKAALATGAFLGEPGDSHNHRPRIGWGEALRGADLGSQLYAGWATYSARTDPALDPLASRLAVAQFYGHVFTRPREALAPILTTGHVGHPDAPLHRNGKRLRPEDIGWKESLVYGVAVVVTEFASQILTQLTLGQRSASDAGLTLSLLAAAFHGVRMNFTSALEDTIIATAEEGKLREEDEQYARTISVSWHNPFTGKQLGRQFERVQARIFNSNVPNMLAVTALYFMEPVLDGQWSSMVVTAVVYALVNGAVLGVGLSPTVRTYQMNDALRQRNAAPSGVED